MNLIDTGLESVTFKDGKATARAVFITSKTGEIEMENGKPKHVPEDWEMQHVELLINIPDSLLLCNAILRALEGSIASEVERRNMADKRPDFAVAIA